MFNDQLDALPAVANVVVFEFFDVGGINGFAHNFVNDDRINDLLFRLLLAHKVVNACDVCMICEGRVVCEANWHNRRCVKAVDNYVWVSHDAMILGVVERNCKVAMSSPPAC